MTHKIIKKEGRLYIELPEQFINDEELEFFELRDGYYLLTRKLGQPEKKVVEQSPILSEEEKNVLRKLLAVKFELRTPPNVEKQITHEEKLILNEMEKKNMITIYKSKKYPDGVYNVKDSVYGMLKELPKQEERDYVIISDQKEAYFFSLNMKKSGKDKDIIAVRGFDGKFYAVNKKYFTKTSELVKQALLEDGQVAKVATKYKLPIDACRAILAVLAERGEVIEKRTDTFALA